MRILGAGIAGMLAGLAFPKAEIHEAASSFKESHKALMRFRTKDIGVFCGIPFREVLVRKGIWCDGKFEGVSIKRANQYSKKVIGRVIERSIWNLDDSIRYIAPDDFVVQLSDRLGERVIYNSPFKEVGDDICISTIPMSTMTRIVTPPKKTPSFEFQAINVKRWLVKDADVFQTIYFPDPATNLYRASITKDLLIAEGMGDFECEQVMEAFGLSQDDVVLLEDVKQSYGKIAPIDEDWRLSYIGWLTTEKKIFSLGRYGTWRNILLDDVLKDINIIKRWLKGRD